MQVWILPSAHNYTFYNMQYHSFSVLAASQMMNSKTIINTYFCRGLACILKVAPTDSMVLNANKRARIVYIEKFSTLSLQRMWSIIRWLRMKICGMRFMQWDDVKYFLEIGQDKHSNASREKWENALTNDEIRQSVFNHFLIVGKNKVLIQPSQASHIHK